MLSTHKFNRIQACTIEELNISRIADTTYSFSIPEVTGKRHQQAKLRRWGLAILLNAPEIGVGERLHVQSQLQLRHPTKLRHEYDWELAEADTAIGTMTDATDEELHTIVVKQQPNGIHWRVQEDQQGDAVTAADATKLQKRQHEGSIIFDAHPSVHGFPWRVNDSIANKHVLNVLKKQSYQRYKGEDRKITKVLEGLRDRAKTSTWQRAVMRQTPKQLWAHKRELTEYQVWVVYRVAVRQLNLYYEGKAQDNSCRKLEECKNSKKTMEHIFWECPCAQACWTKLIQQWTGESWTQAEIQSWQRNCASRQAPVLGKRRRTKIKVDTPDEEKEIKQVWNRMWWILASVCVTTLWIQRNRVIFHQEEVMAESSVQEFWATGRSQLKALAMRERRTPDQQIQGTRLYLCQQEMERKPREHSTQVKGPVQPPDQDQEPALLTRLRKYHTSSRQ